MLVFGALRLPLVPKQSRALVANRGLYQFGNEGGRFEPGEVLMKRGVDSRSQPNLSDGMRQSLTTFQDVVIKRLNFLGLEDVAQRATVAWAHGRFFPGALTPAEW